MQSRGAEGDAAEVFIAPLTAAAHELKSPLSLIRQLSLQIDAQSTSSELHRALQHITLTAERALRVTTDLTKSARLQDALFQLEPLNPEQVCREVVYELQPLYAAHNKSLSFTHRSNQLLLVANRDLLRRILTNFSDNALHYTQPGTNVTLHIKSLKQRGTIRIAVRDFGPSVSTDTWQALRKKLRKAPQPIHSRPQSSGLGLYLASQFAEAMHGAVGMTRHRNGATFYVDLQASQQLSLL